MGLLFGAFGLPSRSWKVRRNCRTTLLLAPVLFLAVLAATRATMLAAAARAAARAAALPTAWSIASFPVTRSLRRLTPSASGRRYRACVRRVAMAAGSEAEIRAEVQSMRAREIKQKLEALGVDAADAFEKSELVERLVRAQLDGVQAPQREAESGTVPEAATAGEEAADVGALDPEILATCRAMRVTDLRTQLGSRGIRWADAVDKEELVERLANVLATELSFSSSGRLRPGTVSKLNGAELTIELDQGSTPLLLDVYATWCGPCQMMAPHLEAAARSLGNRVRVAKLDSDEEPAWATKLRVGGLPTIILFDKQGQEVVRKEGALMEQQLLSMVSAHI